jgi:transcriptional regulator with XRE-family HTH domain
MSIGDIMYFKRIKDLRCDHDYSQQYVSDYLKINRVVYSRYETGIRDIPVDLLIKLSSLYDVSVDYILGISDKKSKD